MKKFEYINFFQKTTALQSRPYYVIRCYTLHTALDMLIFKAEDMSNWFWSTIPSTSLEYQYSRAYSSEKYSSELFERNGIRAQPCMKDR